MKDTTKVEIKTRHGKKKHNCKAKPHELSQEDRLELLKYYGNLQLYFVSFSCLPATFSLFHVYLSYVDTNNDGILEDDEITAIIDDYNNHRPMHIGVLKVLRSYDENNMGELDSNEIFAVFKSTDSSARYAAYSASMARAFRYLAFSSDFGEALRPVSSPKMVNVSYAVAGAYCVTDVAWEAYKCKSRGYQTDQGVSMTMSQCVIERATFQALASVAIPFALIHTSVDLTKKICKRIGRFQKWGPSVAGLLAIPILPIYLDEPVEKAVENFFHQYGPWSSNDKHSIAAGRAAVKQD